MPPRRSTATPRATRTKQRTPLPAVPSAPSFAYGAPGKAELRTQVRASGRDFGEGFEAARQASVEPESVAEAEEEDEVDASSVVPPSEIMDRNLRTTRRAPSAPVEKKVTRQTPKAAARIVTDPQPEPESEPESEPQVEATLARADAERVATALDAGARYQPAQPEVAGRAEPSKSRAPITVWLVTILAVLGLLTVLANVPLPENLAIKRNDNIHAFKRVLHLDPWSVPPSFLQENWYRFQHDRIFSRDLPAHNMPELQYVINIGFLKRLEQVEEKVAGLEDDMRLQKESMAAIQEMLPSHLVVQFVDGRYQIPDLFWDALRERLLTNSDMTPLWQAFISRSESQVADLFSDAVDTRVQRAIEEHHVVTSDYFAQLMSEKYEELSNWSRNELDNIQSHNLDEMKAIAAGAASEVVKQYPSAQFLQSQLGRLSTMHEAYNLYTKISETNWFAIGNGARVDPGTTSDTHGPKASSWWQGFLQWISPLHVSKYPAIAALKPWSEPTDCWCASHETYGYAQIGIKLPQKIYPEQFTIEHIPATGTRDVKAAPREFEVWADIGDVNTASQLATDLVQDTWIALRRPCGPSPGPSHVCILSSSYDIHKSNWVQQYWVIDDRSTLEKARDAGIRSNTFLIRFTSNYGEADYTCLYRLRMAGEKVEYET